MPIIAPTPWLNNSNLDKNAKSVFRHIQHSSPHCLTTCTLIYTQVVVLAVVVKPCWLLSACCLAISLRFTVTEAPGQQQSMKYWRPFTPIPAERKHRVRMNSLETFKVTQQGATIMPVYQTATLKSRAPYLLILIIKWVTSFRFDIAAGRYISPQVKQFSVQWAQTWMLTVSLASSR